jgi:squalene-hopene/tetraprenyl-beta-curcumene cyclase
MSRIAEKPAPSTGAGTQARADVVALTLTKTVSTLLDRAIALARDAMIARQTAAGYWLFELEADATIPAEYIMMMHFLDEIDAVLEAKIAAYLRAHQSANGGWPLYAGGEFNMSCTVKAYYALKLAGDDIHAAHMVRARGARIERGGAGAADR